MSLARLWRDQAKRDAARELLAPVHGCFTEGFDTLDLKQAKPHLVIERVTFAFGGQREVTSAGPAMDRAA